MKIDINSPIGVFDSGVGGLTVAREIMKNLPKERVCYFGDTARVPYGSKSKETVIRYSRQIINFLKSQNVKAIVIACNTASAFALKEVQKEFDIPIIGVIEPGAEVAVKKTKNKKVGIIGTIGTISSGIHKETITKINPTIQVIGKACPLFVPLVEEGWLEDDITKQVVTRYLSELKEKEIDTLILGCTHYPLIRNVIGEVMGNEVSLVDPAYETAIKLKQVLGEKNLLANKKETEHFPYKFFVSDLAEKFTQFANSILPYDINRTRKIDIESYEEK